ncbi:TlpA disulfide reductase family protein [Pasteurellaceae bacterium LIM206]|nr:TlpA disulfide reductase family protein [Pasteurellaceae bacterium LIM206]
MYAKRKTRKLSTALWLAAALLSLAACKDETAQIGSKAPEIAVFDLQGKQANLEQWQGKTRLMTFWSTTCGVCVAELKTLEKAVQTHPEIQLIAINIDGAKVDIQPTIRKRELTLPIFKDQLGITAERYQVVGTPTTFIIDKQGKILQKYESLIPPEDLEKLFNQG